MKTRTWSLISLACFLAAILCWLAGNRRSASHNPAPPAPAPTSSLGRLHSAPVRLLSSLHLTAAPAPPAAPSSAAPTNPGTLPPDPQFPSRLRNTLRPLDELVSRDSALLLRNALIDSESATPLDLPDHLRAGSEPGAYLVQARGPITAAFRDTLSSRGATVVSYIPNNAFLVRASPDTARAIAALPGTRTVRPFEPYYKINPDLLDCARDQTDLPAGSWLNLTAFPGAADEVRSALTALGAQPLAESPSPFGPQFVVAPTPSSLVALAQLPGVQLIEPYSAREFMADLTRTRLAVSADTTNALNYFDLTGSNVWVSLNDTGVDSQHPALKDRVFSDVPLPLTDTNGHGTHVAGIIAGSGAGFPTLTNPPPGSLTNASFRGLAPAAKLFVLPVDLLLGPLQTDAYLQETAASTNYVVLGRTNALISNNSWNYPRRREYNTAAAAYDAAVRDALADRAGPQAMIYVFSAGNEGRGTDSGLGGDPNTITSPATAKNVITVGAIESPRTVTYDVVQTNLVTNVVNGEFVVTNVVETNVVTLGETDTDWQVASFSGRGNVGVGQEGQSGRFKPDLVAPGVFAVGPRAEGWDVRTLITNSIVTVYPDQVVAPDTRNSYSINVPTNAIRLIIQLLTNSTATAPLPGLPIYAKAGDFPTTNDFIDTNLVILGTNSTPKLVPGPWYYDVGNLTADSVPFDLRTIVEVSVDFGKLYETLTNLNQALAPDYRYHSGTSVSAGAVSGLLALIQEFFELRLKRPYSPALLKALLINGARSLGPLYSLDTRPRVNYQGWGLPRLDTVLPTALTNETDETKWPTQWLDQNPTNTLATGESRAYQLKLPDTEEEADVRITLVWTDPPGNPAASLKLVNDLDLVVSNCVTGELYAGNDIPLTSDYNQPAGTNALPRFDTVNNVENVFLRRPKDTNFTVQVVARRVNVNTLPAHTNGIVQDFALVVSRLGTNYFEFKPRLFETNAPPAAAQVTNGVPLLQERVGANSPLQNYPAGLSNQWHFYVFTNTFRPGIDLLTNGQFVRFLTFVPANLSTRRHEQADIDLYVTRGNDRLLTLDPAALGSALKSVRRGGTEWVFLTNAAPDEVFYVGVKSEDQMAAEYAFVILSTQFPGEYVDNEGNHILQGMPLRIPIPDGTPIEPGTNMVFAFGHTPILVGQVVATVTNIHQRPGDLVGNLDHLGQFVVLNNHNDGDGQPPGWVGGIYDDSGSGAIPSSIPTDGPGNLNDFLGSDGTGPWVFTSIDNSAGHTGHVENLVLRLTPNPDLLAGVYGTVLPNQWKYYFFDVPADASRLTLLLSRLTGRLGVYLRHGSLPTLSEYDKRAVVSPPGGFLTLSYLDSPPLTAGRYWIGLFNPDAAPVDYFLQVRLERNLPASFRRDFHPTNSLALGDDLRSVSTNNVDDSRNVSRVQAGLRINHERISDLAVYLVNPQNDRVLLNENRGGPDRQQYGYDTVITNYHHVALTYSTNTGLATLYLDGQLQAQRDFGPLTLRTAYDFFLGYKATTNGQPTQYLGGLDEVSLYRRALPASEILALYKFGGAGRPTNDLVSRWPLDGFGVDLQTNNPATVVGPTPIAGRFDAALDFAAITHRVWATNSPSLDVGLAAGFTLDAWINPRDLAAERPIAVWGDGTNAAGLEFYIRPGNDTNRPPGLLAARLVDRNGFTNDLVAATQGLIRTNAFLTNTVYTTFTDDTNLAFLPIKFGTPATNANYHATNILVSGLEITNPALPLVFFTNTESFDGWTVLAGTAAVLSAPPMVHTGTNLLALQDAVLDRTLPTRAGHAYRLQWVNRAQTLPEGIVGWWPGEDSPADIASTNTGTVVGPEFYVPTLVNRGFAFLDRATHLRAEPGDSLNFTNALTFETWFLCPGPNPLYGGLLFKGDAGNAVNCALALSVQGIDVWFDDPATTDPQSDAADGRELMHTAGAPTPDRWHHIAATFRQISPVQVELQLFLDGELRRAKVLRGTLRGAANNNPLLIGTGPAGNAIVGFIDEPAVYSRTLSSTEIQEIHLLDALGKRHPRWLAQTRLVLDTTQSNLFTAPIAWETNSMTFLAATDNTPVQLQSVLRGAFFDSFELLELEPTYFLPEEELTPLLAKNAYGDWHLEVYDRRTGALLPVTPELLDWNLQLTFAPRRYPTITLTNGITYTNIIGRNQARFFVVEVPASAGHATNTLTAATPQDLWFNQDALPLTDPAGGDLKLLSAATFGIAVLATNGLWEADTNGLPITPVAPAPRLLPGQRYYLALTNTGPLQTYTVRVDFDALDTNLLGVVPLAFGQTILTNIAPTNYMQYYRYSVTTNAAAASFELEPVDGNVDLFIRKAQAVPDPLPTPRVFDYASENPGTNADTILVSQNSIVPLGSGDWYLGVLTLETNTVQYRIRVVEFIDPLAGITRLAENVPTRSTNRAGAPLPAYFLFTVSNDPPALQLDLYDLSARASLWVQNGRRPTPDDFYAADNGSPAAPARLVLRTNDALPSLRGNWILAITHDEPAGAPDLTYWVLASLPPPTPIIPLLPASVTISNTLAADTLGAPRAPDFYRIPVSSLTTNLDLALAPVDGNVDLCLRQGLPLPDLANWDYLGANPDLAPELLQIDAASAPVPLAPGDWYVAIYNQSLNSVTYSLTVLQTVSTAANIGPVLTPTVAVSGHTLSFSWQAAPGVGFQIEYATAIPTSGPIQWIALPAVYWSASGLFSFTDDGSLTGGPATARFFRLRQLP